MIVSHWWNFIHLSLSKNRQRNVGIFYHSKLKKKKSYGKFKEVVVKGKLSNLQDYVGSLNIMNIIYKKISYGINVTSKKTCDLKSQKGL